MVISKELLTDLKEIYEKALKLVTDESKNDPSTDPFRSHYLAKNLMVKLKENLQKSILAAPDDDADEENSDYVLYKIILGWVNRDLGRIYIFAEEISTGEKAIIESIDLLQPYHLRPEAIIPYLGALNELGIVNCNRTEHTVAYDYLIKSENIYMEYKKLNKDALLISDIFGTPEEIEKGKGPIELESVYTFTTFYLAQVLGHLGRMADSAKYCHLTLSRQLNSKTYEPIDFALNLATLSQYFIGENLYKEARHHLAAATMVMAEYEAKMITTEMTEQQINDTRETFKHRHADLARCWAKYGLNLLDASRERLYNDDDIKISNDIKQLSLDFFRFKELDLSAYENRVSCDYCLTFDDAKLIYHFVITWLDEAKEYYKPDTEATEYSKIIKDYADLYLHMAFFEEDPQNQAKMHKRRAKYYEELIELLNPAFYLVICRDAWYGAGHAYTAILDIKLDTIAESKSPTAQQMQKISQLCQSAIKNFKQFLDTYIDKETEEIKTGLDAEEERCVLSVYFYLGRLYYKMMSPDLANQLESLENSYKYYKIFIDECAVRKETAKTLQAEVGVCREMVNLLPLKVENLKKRLAK